MDQHEYAEVNGVRLHYVTAGRGRLIMFVHGFPESWYAWRNQLADLGQDHQAVALDMRGYNLSSKPSEVEQYGIAYLVEDLRALCRHLGHQKMILVGHDWGGVVAWSLAIMHPGVVEKLVIINAPHPGIFQRELRENPDQRRASQYMLMLRSSQAEQLLSANHYAALVDIVLKPGLEQGYFTEQDRAAYLEAWSQPGALTGGLNYYRAARIGPPGTHAVALPFMPTELGSLMVKAPTLVIWGERDTFLLSGNLKGLEQFVPDLAIHRIPDGTHWVVHEKPDVVNSAIRDFVAREQRGSTAV